MLANPTGEPEAWESRHQGPNFKFPRLYAPCASIMERFRLKRVCQRWVDEGLRTVLQLLKRGGLCDEGFREILSGSCLRSSRLVTDRLLDCVGRSVCQTSYAGGKCEDGSTRAASKWGIFFGDDRFRADLCLRAARWGLQKPAWSLIVSMVLGAAGCWVGLVGHTASGQTMAL